MFNAYRYLAGEGEAVGWTLLFAVAVVIAASAGAHGASTGHLPFPPLVWSLSGRFSYENRWFSRSSPYQKLKLLYDGAYNWLLGSTANLEGLPSSATSGKDRFSDSPWGSNCTFYVWTSTPALAPISHIAAEKINRQHKQIHGWFK